jgi:hypothetical protein
MQFPRRNRKLQNRASVASGRDVVPLIADVSTISANDQGESDAQDVPHRPRRSNGRRGHVANDRPGNWEWVIADTG